MTPMVQLTVAGDVTEAEEIQEILSAAGIDSALETAVDHHPDETRTTYRRRCSSRRSRWRPRRTRSKPSPSRTSCPRS